MTGCRSGDGTEQALPRCLATCPYLLCERLRWSCGARSHLSFGGEVPARCAWTELRAAEVHEAWVLSESGAQSRCGVRASFRKACLWVDVRLVVGAGIQGPARWAGAQVAVQVGTLRVKQWGEPWTFRTRCPVTA